MRIVQIVWRANGDVVNLIAFAFQFVEVAIEAFDRRVRLGSDEPFTRYYAAAAHALMGDADTAIAFLERAAAARRAFTLERARIEPEFAALRKDVRLQRLLETRAPA